MRAIAFYLPQFHPIPENDAWWGKGFTEWTNVTRAQPLFSGHYQPHLPADLGFYDLRLPEARQAQADLAQEYGIYGFCYYHYWFGGKRILDRPINDILSSNKPDFPFCFCWANENWSRRWDGEDQRLLLKQTYSTDDDLNHIHSLIPAFKDSRYVKVHGKPLFLVYRINHLPQPARTIQCWREEALKAGFPGLYLANVESFSSERAAVSKLPLDAGVEFAPDWDCAPAVDDKSFAAVIREMFGLPKPKYKISSYPALRDIMMKKSKPEYLRYRCATPMWDNTARRRENAHVFVGSTPQLYKEWLSQLIQEFTPPTPEENFIFLNAWNEWAEGNHLEPCLKWGLQYLEANRDAFRQAAIGVCPK